MIKELKSIRHSVEVNKPAIRVSKQNNNEHDEKNRQKQQKSSLIDPKRN